MSVSLRIAIVHYHLKRGGVTRVIESTLRGLESLPGSIQCVVLAGEVPAEVSFRQQAVTVAGLRYSNAQPQTPSPETLLAQLQDAATNALGDAPDVWHIHNHSLGKNSSIPELVARLAEDGAAVLLQMHDFAEDGRPENYQLIPSAQRLYPETARVHYAVINARDAAFVGDMGVAADCLHLLPNPVEGSPVDPRGSTPSIREQASNPIRAALAAERLFLYPVRAVRRKNFGEMLLWAALADTGDVFATTLGPTNRNYVAAYERWKALAASLDLPVKFAIGETHDWPFESIMAAATAILSTSIAEGFGLAFLEPWLYGKAIVGRDLPLITADFQASGIHLDSLYDGLGIPLDWIDLDALHADIESGLRVAYATYQVALPPDATERALAAITLPDGRIDFGGLNEKQQERIIKRVVEDPSARKAIRQQIDPTSDFVHTNAARIREHYGLAHYAVTLEQVYQNLKSTPAGPVNFHDGKQLLATFLQPENFRLLRT